ncbi:unnamed protein product [Rhodiola kirilowii]
MFDIGILVSVADIISSDGADVIQTIHGKRLTASLTQIEVALIKADSSQVSAFLMKKPLFVRNLLTTYKHWR